MKRIIIFFLILAMAFSTLWAENADYEPYQPEEFHPALHGLRRSEVLFFGSIPVSFIYANLGVMAYSGLTNAELGSDQRNRALLYTTLSLSLSVVIIDLIIGYIRK